MQAVCDRLDAIVVRTRQAGINTKTKREHHGSLRACQSQNLVGVLFRMGHKCEAGL